jgi:hypothetical protein
MNRTTHPVEAEEVMAYLDGELAPARATEVAAHLAQCAECRALDTDLRRVSGQIAAWQVEPSPERLEEQVTSALKGRQSQEVITARPPRRPWFRRGWVLALAGCCGFLYLLVVVMTPNLLKSRMASPGAYERELRQAAQRTTDVSPSAAPEEGLGGPVGGLRKRAEPADKLTGPMVIRRAVLALTTGDFDNARAEMQRLVALHRGYIGQLETASPTGAARSLKATLRVPADQLDAIIAGLKKLGRVEQESQTGEEVTQQYVDLVARLSNARNTEQRLIQVLRQNTGRVSDILQVEKEIARVREEIERMEAQRKNLETLVSFATLEFRLGEEFKAQFQAPPSMARRLWNEFVEGCRSAFDSAFGLALFVLGYGPSLLLWFAILFFPVRFAWRRLRATRKARD